jgi:hypothetical protein
MFTLMAGAALTILLLKQTPDKKRKPWILVHVRLFQFFEMMIGYRMARKPLSSG